MEVLPTTEAAFARVTGERHAELVRMAPSLVCLAGDRRILVIHPRTREIAEIEIPLPRSWSLGDAVPFARAVPLHNPRDASTATGFAFVTKSTTPTGLPQYLVVLALSNRDAAIVLDSGPAPMTLHCDVPGQLVVVHPSCTADVLCVDEFLRADPATVADHGRVCIQTEQPILDVYQPSPDRWIVLCLGREGAGNVVRTYTRDLTSFSQVRPSLIYMSTHLRSLGKAIVSGCKTIAILPKENHEVTRITTVDVFTLAELPVSPSFPHPLSDRQYGGSSSAGPVFVAIDGTRTASLRVRHEGPEPDTFAVAGARTFPWVSAPAADGSEPSCAIVLKGADGVERACPVWIGEDGRLYVAMEQDGPPVAVF
jgi:hypothetical protein